MKPRILLLSGTHEGPLLALALAGAGFDVHATVTREEAVANLFGPLLDKIAVEVRGFTEQSLSEFLAEGRADLVLDATHPFAARITRIAESACSRTGIPLVRYERPDWEPPEGTLHANTFVEAAALLPSLGSRAMLTIGSKQLKHFAHLHSQVRLFARILPSVVSLQQALEAGFTQENILCLRPPFSLEFNQAIFKEHACDVLVTKASGREGGVVEKVLAARNLGMNVLMIRRPDPGSSSTVASVEDAVQNCRNLLISTEHEPPTKKGYATDR